jgi:hypothetical protein
MTKSEVVKNQSGNNLPVEWLGVNLGVALIGPKLRKRRPISGLQRTLHSVKLSRDNNSVGLLRGHGRHIYFGTSKICQSAETPY